MKTQWNNNSLHDSAIVIHWNISNVQTVPTLPALAITHVLSLNDHRSILSPMTVSLMLGCQSDVTSTSRHPTCWQTCARSTA